MKIIVQFSDNETVLLNATPEETLFDAAKRQGLRWPIDCAEGVCGSCKCQIISGTVDHGFYTDEALTQEEITAGYALGCQTRAKSDLIVSLRMPLARLRRATPPMLSAHIVRLDTVAKDTVHLVLQLNQPIEFLPGQYAKLKVPGSNDWRAYSFTNIPNHDQVGMLIRLLPSGQMSDYLRRAQVGEVLELTGPHGIFFMRDYSSPAVMIAGGTGLGPMLSMLQTLAADDRASAMQSARLLYGVNDAAEIACLDILEAVKEKLPGFSWTISVANASAQYRQGFATDLLDDFTAADVASTTFYLCGPPPMIDAGRAKLKNLGVSEEKIIYEKFIASQ